jgi:hypothetical protein
VPVGALENARIWFSCILSARHRGGFIDTCLPTLAATVPLGKSRVNEIKDDEARAVAALMPPSAGWVAPFNANSSDGLYG